MTMDEVHKINDSKIESAALLSDINVTIRFRQTYTDIPPEHFRNITPYW
jgi:hypothetical protein